MTTRTFDWSQEIDQVITKSLVTTFGLDFLLLEDKKGGDVDTIHNVRKGIWATEAEKQKCTNLEPYDSQAYHQHPDFIKKGREDKKKQQEGTLKDGYTGQIITPEQKRDLDHVISAHEIHHDAGRILAEVDGVELANQESNLSSTLSSINRTKKQHSVDDFVKKIPQTYNNREAELLNLKNKLETMPQNTPQQKHEYQKVQDEIRKKQKSLEELKQISFDEMGEINQQAREEYNQQINKSYYTSSKFFKSTISASLNNGFRMGARESIGLVLAEMWFEFKGQIPNLYHQYKNLGFNISQFLEDVKQTIINIYDRVKLRFKEIIDTFKDSTMSGVFSSISTTILNAFITTTKFWGKIIRETWLNIVKISKLVFFNPENLTTGQLAKAAFTILSASIGVVVGMLVNESLIVVDGLPFGAEIRMFLTALATGIVTLGLSYFIQQSPMMQKIWAYLDGFKTKYERLSEHFDEINTELDRYILELTQLEFAIDVIELESFAKNLKQANSELERQVILKQRIEQQNIKLPFEMGNRESTKNWLLSKMKK
ncbi:MAG: DNA repair protein [Pseudomonadales bacterium]|nr:DNA repair protein [Pseudomonadales bacterium]